MSTAFKICYSLSNSLESVSINFFYQLANTIRDRHSGYIFIPNNEDSVSELIKADLSLQAKFYIGINFLHIITGAAF